MTRDTSTDELAHAPLEEVMGKLGYSPDGLVAALVQERTDTYGLNEIAEKRVHPILKFLTYFWGPIPWMIEGAALLSRLVHHYSDFGIIVVLLIANAVVGFWEEFQAGNAIATLKARLATMARVRRDGVWRTIPARELVPGDLLRVRFGEIVPADVRLLEGDPLSVDQSALTGESLPLKAGKGAVVYSGSIVKRGETEAIVFATGTRTYFGTTVHLVETAHRESHFQKAILKIGDYLIVLAVALVVLIVMVALFRQDHFLTTLQFALVLLVAAIPVAMPTVLSVTMAVGARLLAKKEAIVTRLASIEELAGIDVLCTDKTGTLTQNTLTLGDPFVVDGENAGHVLFAAALASRGEDNDPIDKAVLSGADESLNIRNFTVTHFMPFDPVHKRTEGSVRSPDGSTFTVTKGAPQVILEMCSLEGELKRRTEEVVNDFARRGYRALGVARADSPGAWRLLGILPLYDPPRTDSLATIAAAKEMGISIKMVTGDQLAIAKETARVLGLGTNIMDVGMFKDTLYHESGKMAEAIESADGFAQVYPEHKFHIVETLQRSGHIVGMTGDGVNDAPALKKAHAGIAVSGATDAARSAADIALLAPGISVIIDAIKESRKIFQKMNSYAIYRIAETIRVLLFMTLSILVFNFYPITAVMIVLLALLNDGAILSIAYDRARGSMKPEAWNMREVLGIATVLGIIGVVASFLLFYIAEHHFHMSREMIQPLMYLKLSVAGHLTIFVTRTRGHFWSYRPSGILFGAVMGTQVIATIIAVYGIFMPALGWGWALVIWAYALVSFLIADWVKVWMYRILNHGQIILSTRKRDGVPADTQHA
jgi:H+-transporting ATPase